MATKGKCYTHGGKGGLYKVIDVATMAGMETGPLRGTAMVVYRCVPSGRLYVRTQESFDRMMVMIVRNQADGKITRG